jgi:hypothetical protein
MHAPERKGAFHEPAVWCPGFSRFWPPEGGTPNLWRPADWFTVPMHAKKRKGALHEPQENTLAKPTAYKVVARGVYPHGPAAGVGEDFDAVSDDDGHCSEPNSAFDDTTRPIPAPNVRSFFERTDWMSFGVTSALALGVYLFTLAPDVTLGLSGIFSVGAFYAGVPHPPGYPLWTFYAWVFTWMVPFSNIAWRVAVSSAVAGALACGVVSLMVSRGGAMIGAGIAGTARLKPKEEVALRVVCGCVAGLGLGFDGGFWRKAVVADPWPLSLLLLAVVLGLLMTWRHAPDRRRYLYAASFVYGLTVSNKETNPTKLNDDLGLPMIRRRRRYSSSLVNR